MKSDLVKVRALVESGWTKDFLARDAKKQPSNQFGNTNVLYDKDGKVIKEDFMPAVSWSLVGALLNVSQSQRIPNEKFSTLVGILMPYVKARGYNYLADFNDAKQTKVEDVIELLDEAISRCPQ